MFTADVYVAVRVVVVRLLHVVRCVLAGRRRQRELGLGLRLGLADALRRLLQPRAPALRRAALALRALPQPRAR